MKNIVKNIDKLLKNCEVDEKLKMELKKKKDIFIKDKIVKK